MLLSGCSYGVALWFAVAGVAGSAVAASDAPASLADEGDEGDEGDELDEPTDADPTDADPTDGDGSSDPTADAPDIEDVSVDAETSDQTDADVEDEDLLMVEIIPQDRKVRHNWYLGVGMGGGVGVSTVKQGNTLDLDPVKRQVGAGAALFFHAGGRLREKIYLGGRFALAGGGSTSGASVMLEALYFPIANRGLLLGAAVGPGVVAGPSDKGEKPAHFAAGLAAEIGYDFWLLPRFNLGIVLQANAVLNGRQAHMFMGTLGLQFNLY